MLIPVKINQVSIPMEIDTGSIISVINRDVFNNFFSNVKSCLVIMF